MAHLTEQDQENIASAIAEAEQKTSGEIRIAYEKNLRGDALERAKMFFFKLGMDKTAQHNGVLIYLAAEDRKFAIIGDSGINRLIPADFWDCTREAMIADFKTGSLSKGIITGINKAAEQLSHYFPPKKDDINELPNDVYIID